jgi:hypothetical protein
MSDELAAAESKKKVLKKFEDIGTELRSFGDSLALYHEHVRRALLEKEAAEENQ